MKLLITLSITFLITVLGYSQNDVLFEGSNPRVVAKMDNAYGGFYFNKSAGIKGGLIYDHVDNVIRLGHTSNPHNEFGFSLRTDGTHAGNFAMGMTPGQHYFSIFHNSIKVAGSVNHSSNSAHLALVEDDDDDFARIWFLNSGDTNRWALIGKSTPTDSKIGMAYNGVGKFIVDTLGHALFNNAFKLPNTDGQTGEVLITNGNGAVEWGDVSSSAMELIDADGDTKITVEETTDSDEINFYSNSSLLVNMKEDTMYIPKGVYSGYGTTEPLDPIHVVAEDDDEYAGFYAEGGTGTKHVHYILDNRTANGKRYSLVSVGEDSSIPNGSFAIRDLDNSTERILVDPSGDVGIGINNPQSKLHVNGSAIVNGTFTIGDEVITDAGTNILRAAANFTPSQNANYNLGGSSYKWKNMWLSGDLNIGNGAGMYTLPNTDGTSGEALITDGNGDVSWGAVSSSSIEVMDADGDTKITVEETTDSDEINFYSNSSLLINMKEDTMYIPKGVYSGFGTTEPLDPIHVVAEDDDEYAGFYAEGGTGTKHVHYILDNRTANGKRYSLVSVGEDSSIPNGSFAIRDLDNGTERILVDPSGDVGIGINNPQSKLHVNGSAIVNGTLTIGDEVITDAGTNILRAAANFTPSQNANYNLGGSSYKWKNMWLSGDLNIGNGAVMYSLPNTDGASGEALITDGNGDVSWGAVASSSMELIDADGDTKITVEETTDSDEINFYSNSSLLVNMKEDTMYIPKGVFSGYGTTEPLDPIHVVAEDDDEFAGFYAEGGTGTKHVHYILDNRTANGKRYSLVSVGDDSSIPNGSFAIRDLDNSTERILVDPSGDVGINTPQSKLHVNGSTQVDGELKVQDNLLVGVGQGAELYIGDEMITDGGIELLRAEANFTPSQTATYSLGGFSFKWDDLWMDGALHVGTGEIYEDGTNLLKTDSHFVSELNDSKDLGTSSLRWKDVHLDGKLHIGTQYLTKNPGDAGIFVSTNFAPTSDNVSQLGGGVRRWTEVYAVNGTINTSDKRAKDDIANLKYGLADVLRLRPVDFNWKKNKGEKKTIGLIAQELLEVIPEVVVVPANEDELLGVKYADLVPVLIKAIQEQQAEIESLKSEVSSYAELSSQFAELKASMEQLKDRGQD